MQPEQTMAFTEYKLSQESAWAELRKLIDFYEINLQNIALENGEDAFKTLQNVILDNIRRGVIEIDDSDNTLKVTQHLKRPPGDVKEIVYGEMTGKQRLAAEKAKGGGYQKACAYLGSLSGLGADAFELLKQVDWKVADALLTYFLAP